MRLDVGCGSEPHGDVNIDLYRQETVHRNSAIQPCRIPNFIVADANHLPFRTDAFNHAECHHVLEHKGLSPNCVCKELLRVSRHIEITVPALFRAYVTSNKGHDKVFQADTFHTLFKHYQHKVSYQNPDRWLRLRMPIHLLTRIFGHVGKQLPCPIRTIIHVEVWK